MGKERRQYPRIAINAFIQFYEDIPYTGEPVYRRGIVKNYSERGLSISTERPLPEGSIVVVEIPIESESGDIRIVEVRGIIRRVQPSPGRQTLGVELFEFKESGSRNFNEWMEKLLK